jgi:ABC-2 type transport system permease protein
MKTLMVSPLPRWFLLTCKLLAGVAVSVVQAYIFLAIAWFWEIDPPLLGYLAVLPALVLSGLMLGALGLVLSSFIKQLENFAGVMNFVIFPMFFASSGLYPLWRVKESSLTLWWICQINPFTSATELIRFALYEEFDPRSAAILVAYLLVFMALAIVGYDPGRGLIARRAGAE